MIPVNDIEEHMQLQPLYLKIASDRIHFLKFILEGYDGLAILSTIDTISGLVVVRYPLPLGKELFDLLTEMAGTIKKID